MAKVILGDAPETFPHVVKFTDVITGKKMEIRVKYAYRDRAQVSALIDELMESSKEEAEAMLAGKAMTLKDGSIKAAEQRAEHIMKIVREWDVEPSELNLENLVRFSLRFPAGSDKLVNDYMTAINEGRLGN